MYRVGIDLGGTNIAVGVVSEEYDLISHVSVPTKASRPAEEVIADMCSAVEAALDKASVTIDRCGSIGVGIPGTCISEKGIVVRACNLNWQNVPLRSIMEKRFNVPIRLDNDANCAALAECMAGAARGLKNVVLITLGTGVGSGIVIDGKIFTGMNGAGTEMGHTPLELNGEPCLCGRRGCWEVYASATGLIRQAKRAAEADPGSLLNKAGEINGLAVFEAADKGDAAAQAVIDQYCVYLAAGLANVINIFAPEMVLIGGGISRQGERLLAPVRKMTEELVYDKRPEAVAVIKAAQLGNEAGIIGAAAL